MAAINDLVAQIQDEDLRQQIEAELKRVMKHKKFGLVFEDHLPEGLNDGPIYPGLEVVDSVRHAQNDQLWHALIEADNYYALQLLAYLYPGQVDCIYIDPPYNTGARDWKYNNDYVDSADTYRHSKWLSMMKRRLLLAKRLLNPKDSVLIVTIDEKEYLHLGCLLEELFPEARMQMVSSVINPAGVSRGGQFARTDEYIFFISFGQSAPSPVVLNEDWRGKIKGGYKDKLRWNGLQRSGTATLRTDRPNMFYPIYVNKECTQIVSVGNSIPLETDRKSVVAPEGLIAIWPIFPDGREGRWRLGRDTLLKLIDKHYVKLGKVQGDRASLSYLAEGEQAKVENGDFPIVGYNNDGSIVVDESGYAAKFIPGTQWWITSHDATQKGTKMLNDIIGHRFSFPKSVYAVHDAIRFFVANKPNALIVDFFAGSGTTLHAVNLLNAEDGGQRRCIMVTNNEVSVEEAKSLTAQGYKPGDAEWERLGIAQYVNWPRSVCSITGTDVNGQPLKGEYLGTDHRQMADGFETNAIFFRLNFLDKNNVALGKQFRELLPLLWMKSGAIGTCPILDGEAVPDMLVLPNNEFAVLNNEKAFGEFFQQIMENESIRMVYLIVDSDAMYREMAKALTTGAFALRHIKTCQLYRDYLDNFRINIPR
jgi:adenine-specific DNA-methyltransferase